MLTKLNLREFG